MKSNVIKRRFWITSLLFILLIVISGSYSTSKFDVFAQSPSSSDLGNGPIPEDNSTDVNNGPIPEDNSTDVNNGPAQTSNSTDMSNGPTPENNSTNVNNGPNTLAEENQTNSISDMSPISDNSTLAPETTTSAKTTMLDPLMQFKSGVTAKDVQCRPDFQLVLKAEDGSPACIDKNNVDDLVKRGWAKPVQP